MKKIFEFILTALKKCFVKPDGQIGLKRILGTLIVLGYLGVSIYQGSFENPVAILTLLFTGV
ncbi:MAG: hypothetical protein ACI4N3_01480 [Alphaproteobacteria bacterium]